jgi:glutaredoxin-like protein
MTPQSIISDQDKAQLKRTLRKDLKADVNLRLFTQRPSPLTIPGRECLYCPQTQQLMEEVAELSPKIHLEIFDFYGQPEVAKGYSVDRIPAITIGDTEPARVKYYGIPMGSELATLIEDIKTVSRGVSPLSMNTRKELRRVKQPVHLQVFVTPT